jgi:8-oxo-dGTP diphosphatase
MNSAPSISKNHTFSTIISKVTELSKELPSFPDGRIDYTNAHTIVAVICFVEYKDKILLLKRSEEVGSMRGMWDNAGGYYDELITPEEIGHKELLEEAGITLEHITEMKEGTIIEFEHNNKSYIYCLYYCTVSRESIILDYEHTDHMWVLPKDIENYDTVPYYLENLRLFLPDI